MWISPEVLLRPALCVPGASITVDKKAMCDDVPCPCNAVSVCTSAGGTVSQSFFHAGAILCSSHGADPPFFAHHAPRILRPYFHIWVELWEPKEVILYTILMVSKGWNIAASSVNEEFKMRNLSNMFGIRWPDGGYRLAPNVDGGPD